MLPPFCQQAILLAQRKLASLPADGAMQRVFFLFCGALVLAGVARCEPATIEPAPAVPADINSSFVDPELDVESWVQRFEIESREIYHQRDQIVAKIGLRPGDRVADIGTGTGLFVPLFCDQVGPRGWVYALDIAPRFVEHVGQLAQDKRLVNVTPVLASGNQLRLAPNSVDCAFICDTYHHFEYPAATVRDLFAAVRPGGQLILIDFERIPGKSRPWTLEHVRADKMTFQREIESAGFRFVEEIAVDGFAENYCLRFRRPE